jgi:multidrug efflux pump subunit AcrB
LKDEQGKDYAVFTGDTLFVGDVGRPDLAQKENEISMDDLAGMLYDSLQKKIIPLADDVIVYPAHGAGSSCGKNLGPESFSTIGEQKKSKFYIKTEPYFEKLNASYASYLNRFMKRRWLSFPIIILCFGLIYLFFNILQKETAPYDDRSALVMSITAPEGASYEYTDRFMQEISKLVDDSIPEKTVSLIITSPGFGASTVNSGRVRIALKEPSERNRSQKEIAEKLTKWTKQYLEAKTAVIEQPTIAVNRRGGLPIQYIIQAPNFEKLQEKIPLFMDEANKNPTFSTVDVNLKFNKPETIEIKSC